MTPAAAARGRRRAPSTREHAPRTARTAVAPRAPRRISGPAAGARTARTATASTAVAGGAVALPRVRTGTTGVFERLRALPEHRLVDRVLRGRAWIWLIGLALLGIVAMQVSLLKLNAGISRAVEASATLERQNADLEAAIARQSSGERIRVEAERQGMVMPAAGDVDYVTARPDRDPRRAAARMAPPSEAARQLMASGGRLPGGVLPAEAGAADVASGAEATIPPTPVEETTAEVTPDPEAAAGAPAPATAGEATAGVAPPDDTALGG